MKMTEIGMKKRPCPPPPLGSATKSVTCYLAVGDFYLQTMAALPPSGDISHYYAPKYGMFAKMQIKVQRIIGNRYNTELKALSTHLDVFKYIQNLPSVRDVIQLPDDETLNGKNPDVAKKWREKGNALFAKNCMK